MALWLHEGMVEESVTKDKIAVLMLILKRHSGDGVLTDGDLRKNPSSLTSSSAKSSASVHVCVCVSVRFRM